MSSFLQRASAVIFVCLLLRPLAVAEDKRFEQPQAATTSSAATVFDLRTMKPIRMLTKGTEVIVFERKIDRAGTEWFVIGLKSDSSIRGYIRPARCEMTSASSMVSDPPAASKSFMLPKDSDRVTDLGFRILRTLNDRDGNAAISPYGIWANSRLWLRASDGETRGAMTKVLGFSEDSQDSLMTSLQFRSANLFLKRQTIPLKNDYVDFATNAGAAPQESVFDDAERLRVNGWIAHWSNGQIPDFFAPESWNSGADILFANVACFEAKWKSPFSVFAKDQFHLSAKETVEVELMTHRAKLKWGAPEWLNAQTVRVPYDSSDIEAMWIIPNELEALKEVMTVLGGNKVEALLADGHETDVELITPRFQIGGSADLIETLNLKRSLPEAPTFKNMTDAAVGLSGVIQQVHLMVDEEGTRAAAATVSTGVASGPTDDVPKLVVVDRPFLFLVLHPPSRTVLFAATVVRPTPPAASVPSAPATKQNR